MRLVFVVTQPVEIKSSIFTHCSVYDSLSLVNMDTFCLKNSIVLFSNKCAVLVQMKNINEPMLTFSPFSAFGPFSP